MKEKTIEEYLIALGSNQPVPGGGSAAALLGATGVSLGLMVISLTKGKKRYAEVEEKLLEDEKILLSFRDVFYRLGEKDQEAFLPVAKAYGLPKNTEEEKKIRDIFMGQALYDATLVPLSLMETAESALETLLDVAKSGSKLAVSDAGCGAAALESALKSSAYNVMINLKLMKDDSVRKPLEDRLNRAVSHGAELVQMIEETVKGRI